MRRFVAIKSRIVDNAGVILPKKLLNNTGQAEHQESHLKTADAESQPGRGSSHSTIMAPDLKDIGLLGVSTKTGTSG